MNSPSKSSFKSWFFDFSKSANKVRFWIGMLFSLFLIALQPLPVFDYNFEQFFPQNDEDLSFYNDYQQKFGSDNDYLLTAFQSDENFWENEESLWDFKTISDQLQSLENVDTVLSVFSVQLPRIGTFGARFRPLISFDKDKNTARVEGDLESFRGTLIAESGDSFLILIRNKRGLDKTEGDQLYQEILSVFDKEGKKPIAVAGKIQTQGDFVQLMQAEFGLFFGISLILMVLLLFLIFRSWWTVLVTVLVILFGVIWAFAMILLIGQKLALMSVMQPTIFLIVGLSASIHLLSHLFKEQKLEPRFDLSVEKVFRAMISPVALTFLTTSLGFLSLYFTTVPALKDFGLSTGLGILLMFSAIYLLMPSLLFWFGKGKEMKIKSRASGLHLLPFLILVFRGKKWIPFLFLGLTLASVFMGLQIKVNGFLLDNLPTDHPIQKDFHFFDREFRGSNPLEIYLSVKDNETSLVDYSVLEEIDQIEKYLEETFGELTFLSPNSLMKSLNQAQNQGNPKAFTLPSRGQYARLKPYLERVPVELKNQVLSENSQEGRISARTADLGSYQMGKIRKDFGKFIDEEIDSELLEVRWTGTSFLIDSGHESVTRQMASGLGIAFLLVGVIAGYLFRSWRISFILLIPNIIPLLWMLGLMYLLGIEFKLTTAILFTVAFGIAVDDSIHFMSRLKMELGQGKGFLYGIKRTFLETGKALILTSFVLVLGFSVLMISQFGVTFYTGLLIAAALIFALVADLVLLPVLLLSVKRVFEKKR